MSTSFQVRCSVPFHLADPAGIVFFANAFSLFHQAFEQFIVKEIEPSWTTWFHNKEWIVPVRHAEAQYVHPLYAGRECLITLTLHSLSSSSFTTHVTISQESLCSALKIVHVFCSGATGKKMPIPEKYRVRLAALLNNYSS